MHPHPLSATDYKDHRLFTYCFSNSVEPISFRSPADRFGHVQPFSDVSRHVHLPNWLCTVFFAKTKIIAALSKHCVRFLYRIYIYEALFAMIESGQHADVVAVLSCFAIQVCLHTLHFVGQQVQFGTVQSSENPK